MSETTSGGSSGTGFLPKDKQAKQEQTDTALQEERGNDVGDRYGGDEPLDYPTHEPLSEVTYRDPRPLDWPQKADRSVYIGTVVTADSFDDDEDPQGDYVYANDLDTDDNGVGEIKLGGDKVEHAQVIAGGGQLVLILDGQAKNLGGLGGAIFGELQKALQVNANS